MIHMFLCAFISKVWNHYDQDRSGYIESDELKVKIPALVLFVV